MNDDSGYVYIIQDKIMEKGMMSTPIRMIEINVKK